MIVPGPLALVRASLNGRRPPRAAALITEARVVVRGAYEPDTIVATAGRPLRITFRREDTLACSERVVFPDFGKSAMLPSHEDVTVELAPDRAGEYEFTCELGVLRGRLIITGPGAAARPLTRVLRTRRDIQRETGARR